MRIRTIKPEFFLHEGLFEAERASKLPLRLAFAGLWCAADREGRFKWEPRRLGVQVLPYDDVEFSRVLDALTTRGFIQKYASGTGEFGVIPSFKAHQVINNRERESELPTPPECVVNQPFDACGTRGPRDDDGNDDAKSGREGKGREGKGTRNGMEGEVEGETSAPPAWNPSPEQIEVASWFRRQPTTEWSDKEKKAWRPIGSKPQNFQGDDWMALRFFYGPQGSRYRRQDLQTLLNNWNGEVDRAKNYDPSEK